MLKWSKPCSPKSLNNDADSKITNYTISYNSEFLYGLDTNYEADISKNNSNKFILNERRSHRPIYHTSSEETYCDKQKDYFVEYEMILNSLGELRKWIQLVTQTTLVENNIFNCLDNEFILNKLLTKIFEFPKKKNFVRKIICSWNHREAIFKFLKGCKTLGVKENNIFTINDWSYVVKHPEYCFHDDQWISSIKKILQTFYQLIMKSNIQPTIKVKEINLDVFKDLFYAEEVNTICSEFSETRQEGYNCSTENYDEITAQPIEFRSYIKYKDKRRVRDILKLEKKDKSKRSQSFNRRIRISTPATKSVSESLSTISDEGYFTSATCRSSFLQVVEKEQNRKLKKIEKKKLLSCNSNEKRNSKTERTFNGQTELLDNTNVTIPTEKEMNNLNTFLTEFSNDSLLEIYSKEGVEENDVELRKNYLFNNQNIQSIQNQSSHHYNDINWAQSSVNKIQCYDQLTTELKNVINDLLTIGNTCNDRNLDKLLTKKNLDLFFETIIIPEVLSSESEFSASDEYTSSDEYTLESMPARLKEEKYKKEKDENKKKQKNNTKNAGTDKNRKNEKNNESAFENINHYETIDTPNIDRNLSSESQKFRKSDRKSNKIKKKKTPTQEKALHVNETTSRETYETIPDTNHSKMTVLNNQNDRLYLNPREVSATVREVSATQDNNTITNSNLVAAKSKLKPPKYLNPPKDASLKRNNSIHIKEPEYTWDTADGRHRVYLRSKEGEASSPPVKNVNFKEHNTNINGKLRNNTPHDDIQDILGVSPDIIELLKEEEKFWQKQQELKKWVESRDKQVNNVRKPPLQPARTRPISMNGRINVYSMSESEREIEEERIEKEVDRLMFLRAQQEKFLQTSKENVSRNDSKKYDQHASRNNEKRYDQLNHSSSVSSNIINGRNSRGRSSVHFSTNNKPVYQRSTSIKNNRRTRSGNCFSDDDEVFNDYRRDNTVDNRGYFSDHDAVLESPTFHAGPKKTGKNLRIKCTSCSRSILDERLINIDGYDYNWHVKCFFCVVCRAYLNDKHIVRVRVVDSRLHCRFCYSARNGELMSEV